VVVLFCILATVMCQRRGVNKRDKISELQSEVEELKNIIKDLTSKYGEQRRKVHLIGKELKKYADKFDQKPQAPPVEEKPKKHPFNAKYAYEILRTDLTLFKIVFSENITNLASLISQEVADRSAAINGLRTSLTNTLRTDVTNLEQEISGTAANLTAAFQAFTTNAINVLDANLTSVISTTEAALATSLQNFVTTSISNYNVTLQTEIQTVEGILNEAIEASGIALGNAFILNISTAISALNTTVQTEITNAITAYNTLNQASIATGLTNLQTTILGDINTSSQQLGKVLEAEIREAVEAFMRGLRKEVHERKNAFKALEAQIQVISPGIALPLKK